LAQTHRPGRTALNVPGRPRMATGKRRAREPWATGLDILVRHPGSEAGCWAPAAPGADADGHVVSYEGDVMLSDAVRGVTLRPGTPGACAAALLRKLADRLEQHGDCLLGLARGSKGTFTPGGEPEADRGPRAPAGAAA